jgi:hypothetical protein
MKKGMKRIMIMIMIMLFLSHAALYAQVGINTTSPNAQLDILASNPATPSNTDGILIPRVVTFPATNPTADQQGMMLYLTTTVGAQTPGFYYWDFPTLSWLTIDSNKSWKITGNSGTNVTDHFIGTTDNTPLRYRVNNQNAGIIGGLRENVGLGTGTLEHISIGAFNSSLGFLTLNQNTTGIENTAIGAYSLAKNTTGIYNSALGTESLRNNTIGDSNVAIGSNSLYSNTNGFQNVAVGNGSLYANANGNNNIAVGSRALQNCRSSYNVAVGNYSLNDIAQGINDTALGYNSGNTLLQNVNNAITIGYNSGFATTVSNHVNIGNASTQWIGGQVAWGTYSDERIKDNIKEDVPGLAFIKALRPVTYNLNIKRQHEIANLGKADESGEWKEKYDIEKDRQTGFLAQEVAAAAQRLNYDFNGVYTPKEGKGLYAISYSSFVMPLIKAVQEQDAEIQQLKQQLKKYENLETRLKQLEERILNN